ncbi:DUF625-domain-containing protein [Hortaea werneckii]|uniref:Uncharacterized protein n=2 Tax=Hortaea werneckii TaxID=91943 RepID=A0A3M7J7M1_HORWE|nr:DUF625-domain-containing protein [Hortaea werneckii]OTA22003.1 hypothetical protein BTJ68_15261 [Hortaea werneckii EXF-2000]KAI6823320.1 DUF625-domain-containing protein [Hortaea werneckii]KAI7032317.1 DUF625-domain-containing protein [Hortaea werneckii]KAI7070088.1 DUF625-domain-containing protein [Hortaea werneckii]
MAQPQQNNGQPRPSSPSNSPPSPERKRVKVYELKNNDWYDRGTGFCSGQLIPSPQSTPENPDARILVVSEDDSNRVLLETRISKDDGYQQQQDTLIVWTEANGVDMALSFQEADGCAGVWSFVNEVQQRLNALAGPDDGLSDDILDPVQAISLPEPELGHLDEVEQAIRAAGGTQNSREALIKTILTPAPSPGPEPGPTYILRLGPLVEAAEAAQSVEDLHRLCNIMKHLILLNDSSLIEHVVSDAAIQGVVGALEYDPDFPLHKANHRQYLADTSKFKQVVEIRNEEIVRKIHVTYRLLYLKDVVLARILDDPTFSVLNSLIFFYQVDVVNYLLGDAEFLRQLFGIFRPPPQAPSPAQRPDPNHNKDDDDGQHSPKGTRHSLPTPDTTDLPLDSNPNTPGSGRDKKKDAVLFMRDCCAIGKNIQAQNRASLFQNFIHHGLFAVITYALRHHEASVRVAGTDVLVALIDHDPGLVRQYCFQAIQARQRENSREGPLTDTLIELLLVEVDLGVKSQMADAIKILLDPSSANGMDMLARQANAEILAKRAGAHNAHAGGQNAPPQTEAFIAHFYDHSATRLFKPLMELDKCGPSGVRGLSVQETSLFTHLVEILCFFVRQHSYRSKLFILSENLHSRIALLLHCPQKHMRLTALKWFRTCIGLQDEFHNRQIIQYRLFEPILGIVEATQPKDNLLNSACLDLFEYIKREGIKQLLVHLVENYRERLERLTFVGLFGMLVQRYEQMQAGYVPSNANGMDESSFTTQEGTPRGLHVNGRAAFSGLREMDGDEEAYFDDIEEDEAGTGLPSMEDAAVKPDGVASPHGGAASPMKPLVNYPEDEEEDAMDILASSPDREAAGSKKASSLGEAGGRAGVTDADAPCEDAMDLVNDDSFDTSQTTEHERERGRDRQPVPLESSPGTLAASASPPGPPTPAKRRREDDEEDEMSMLMGSGRTSSSNKRRSSSASITSGTHHVQLDGSTSPGAIQNTELPSQAAETQGGDLSVRSPSTDHKGLEQPVEEAQAGQAAPSQDGSRPSLRRKGSLKTRNMGSENKFVVKPIQLASNAGEKKEEQGK